AFRGTLLELGQQLLGKRSSTSGWPPVAGGTSCVKRDRAPHAAAIVVASAERTGSVHGCVAGCFQASLAQFLPFFLGQMWTPLQLPQTDRPTTVALADVGSAVSIVHVLGQARLEVSL